MALSDRMCMALTILEHELKMVEHRTEYAIFGSSSLAMRGIIHREPDDIDVMVSKRIWGGLLNRPRWTWETPNAGDPPMLITIASAVKICLWFDWNDPWLRIDVEREIRTAEVVDVDGIGLFWLTRLENVKRHKLDAIRYPDNSKRVTHLADVDAIDRALARA